MNWSRFFFYEGLGCAVLYLSVYPCTHRNIEGMLLKKYFCIFGENRKPVTKALKPTMQVCSSMLGLGRHLIFFPVEVRMSYHNLENCTWDSTVVEPTQWTTHAKGLVAIVLLILLDAMGMPPRPRAPSVNIIRCNGNASGVAVLMSAHSRTPYITPSMHFFLWGRGSTGAQGAAAGICLAWAWAKMLKCQKPKNQKMKKSKSHAHCCVKIIFECVY